MNRPEGSGVLSDMTSRGALSVLFVLLGLASPALAQEAEASIASASQASTVLSEQITCLTHKRQEIDRQIALMEQARTQLRSRTATDTMRTDALTTIQTLSQRVATLLRESQACGGVSSVSQTPRTNGQSTASVTTTTTTQTTSTHQNGREVVYVAPPPDPAADNVARAPSGPPVVEENVTVDSNVRVVVAHRVDGEGDIGEDLVRRATRTAMPAISACYDDLVDRGALTSGQLILVFSIGTNGRASRVAIEGDTIRNTRFSQCVRTAGGRIRASSGARGGEARFAYTLAFPASDR